MNLQQLEYIVAVDQHRHFATAADKCFVTQPTLSLMIRKLEEELDVQIFDRSRQPVVPTEAGEAILKQARAILSESSKLKEVVASLKGEVVGELRLGIIPSLSTSLVPLFLPAFLKTFPKVEVVVMEANADDLVQRIKSNAIDAALLSTPLEDSAMMENPLFYEQFVVYSKDEDILSKKFVGQEDLDLRRMWLLQEGHCLRSQVVNLCLLPDENWERQLHYDASSLDMLQRLVDAHGGMTVLPELALLSMDKKNLDKVKFFNQPAPVREISLVTFRLLHKRKILDALCETILSSIPEGMKDYQT